MCGYHNPLKMLRDLEELWPGAHLSEQRFDAHVLAATMGGCPDCTPNRHMLSSHHRQRCMRYKTICDRKEIQDYLKLKHQRLTVLRARTGWQNGDPGSLGSPFEGSLTAASTSQGYRDSGILGPKS